MLVIPYSDVLPKWAYDLGDTCIAALVPAVLTLLIMKIKNRYYNSPPDPSILAFIRTRSFRDEVEELSDPETNILTPTFVNEEVEETNNDLCPYCKTKIFPKDRHCPKCGAPVK
jgi:hypothetical protein